ncbi:MAG: 30S ribosomal protein S4 [Candidatus Thorarchaeota archaeon]|jgi:small subunit ribosomal protein S4
MGDPRRQKKKYVSPKRPFDSDRFESELQVIGTYGLRNKRELWRHKTELSRYRRQARNLLALTAEERATLESDLVGKLVRLGALIGEPTLDSVLDLTLENLLERRLQTIVFRKGMASSAHHARQLVAHGHIALDQAKVTTPSRLISVSEEDRINYIPRSPLNDESHPARMAASAAAQRITAEGTEDASEEDDRRGRDGRRMPDSGQFRESKPGPDEKRGRGDKG